MELTEIKRKLYTAMISCFILFPTSMQIANAESVEEGTGTVLVVYEQEGKENIIPLGEGTKAPQTGDITKASKYYMTSCSSLLMIFLLIYRKEKEKELY